MNQQLPTSSRPVNTADAAARPGSTRSDLLAPGYPPAPTVPAVHPDPNLLFCEGSPMKTEYDFSNAASSATRHVKRKTRITIYLDDEVLEEFRSLSEQSGKGYQTLINAALRNRLAQPRPEPALAE
jgi:uncharacterized protein (DUF4415 family)